MLGYIVFKQKKSKKSTAMTSKIQDLLGQENCFKIVVNIKM